MSMPDIDRALEELRGILNATYNGAEWLEKHGNVLALIAEVVEENARLKAGYEDETTVTVNVLRKWAREQQVRMALHILGDNPQQYWQEKKHG